MMASGGPYPFPGNVPLPPYQQLKEERELVPMEAQMPITTTVVHMAPQANMTLARDHIVWSIFTTAYLNVCCLGVIALAFSVKARDRKLIGDYGGASSYGSTARALNITALMLTLLSFMLIILVVKGVI
ncbi:interferon-induced transmembrane protein 1-like [Paroedura picta]|uniref:interferon-induced transmembrane protein 1-like n=1 Tax=Paroedura picta TaxID=143630 RepID=UPI0040562BB4